MIFSIFYTKTPNTSGLKRLASASAISITDSGVRVSLLFKPANKRLPN